MRILHVIPAVAPRYGGPSTAIVSMCEALNRLPEVQAEVASTDADGAGKRFEPYDWPAGNTKLHLFPHELSERWKYSNALRIWLNKHVGDYDVVHVHAAWSYSTAAACRSARRCGVPVVYRPCGTLSDYTWSLRPARKWAYWLLLERANVANAVAFHCTSEAEAAEVRAHRAARGAIHVIPLGIDPAAWNTDSRPELLRKRCGPAAAGRPIILFLSRLHPKKGITDFLLPALIRLKTDAFLAIVGGEDAHDSSYGDRVRTAIKRLKLRDRVAFLGAVSAAERWAMYDGADVFVLPSLVENFGNVVIEAMARGCPVVTSPGTATHMFVTKADCGRVPPLDPAAIAAAIDELLSNPAYRAAIGGRGRAFVRENLDWTTIAGLIRDVYLTCGQSGS